MARSVVTSLAKFMQQHGYTTRMWEHGCTPEEANAVCYELTEWMRGELAVDGEFLLVWSKRQGTSFSGDNELCYLMEEKAYLMPNPFLEGDAEGFVVACQAIVSGRVNELYTTDVRERILYNAV